MGMWAPFSFFFLSVLFKDGFAFHVFDTPGFALFLMSETLFSLFLPKVMYFW